MQAADDSTTDHLGQDRLKNQEVWERQRAQRIKVKNRRKTYLDQNPDYFSASLELAGPRHRGRIGEMSTTSLILTNADPLLYDRLIRRFQSPAEREAEGRQKGYSGVLEADLMRSEAKLAALNHPESSVVTYRRDARGEIYAEDSHDAPKNKEEGQQQWRREMTERFLRGEDADFDYHAVDENEAWDDRRQEERDEEERWFTEEEPRWILNDDDDDGGPDNDNGHQGHRKEGRVSKVTRGETGIQDF